MIYSISGRIGSGKDTVGGIIQYLTTDWRRQLEKSYGTRADTIEILPYEETMLATDRHLDSSWEVKKWAGKLKDIVCLLLGCTKEELEDREFKDTELGEEWWQYQQYDKNDQEWRRTSLEFYNKLKDYPNAKFRILKLTPRKLMQLTGSDCGRDIIHLNIWVISLMSEYKGRPAPNGLPGGYIKYPNWIITDTRFPNEVEAIKKKGGINIRVERKTELRYPVLWEEFQSSKFDSWDDFLKSKNLLDKVYHSSETALDTYKDWDYVIDNNGTIEELIEQVRQILILEKQI